MVRGLALSRDDLLRRAVIMAIMCQGELNFEAVGSAHLVDVKRYFAHELDELQPLIEQGLLSVDEQGLQVSELGWYFVRAIAMVFDKYLQADLDRKRFSRII